MARETEHLYSDIIKELNFIRRHTKGMDFAAYSNNELVKHAVERALLTISEAVRALPSDHLKTESEIPWTSIKGIGNPLRHEYHRIADKIIWDTVEFHIPPLAKAIKRMARLEVPTRNQKTKTVTDTKNRKPKRK